MLKKKKNCVHNLLEIKQKPPLELKISRHREGADAISFEYGHNNTSFCQLLLEGVELGSAREEWQK